MRLHTVALVAATIAIGGLSLPSVAHHAATMFDRDATVELTGEVVEFQFTAPHIWIEIAVENETGEIEEWSVEGGTPNRLFRAGWRPNSFKPGDQVIIRANPLRDGGRAALFIGAKLADGSILGSFEE